MLLYNESFFKANGYGYACFHIIASPIVLSRLFLLFFIANFKKTIEKKFFSNTIFISNLWKFHNIIMISIKCLFLYELFIQISFKSKLYDLFIISVFNCIITLMFF